MQRLSNITVYDMSEKELLILRQEVEQRKKNPAAAWLLWFFLGLFGAHRFYLGRIGSGIAMLFTGGGFVIWWFVDIFLMSGMLRDNEHKVQAEVIQEIAAMRERDAKPRGYQSREAQQPLKDRLYNTSARPEGLIRREGISNQTWVKREPIDVEILPEPPNTLASQLLEVEAKEHALRNDLLILKDPKRVEGISPELIKEREIELQKQLLDVILKKEEIIRKSQ